LRTFAAERTRARRWKKTRGLTHMSFSPSFRSMSSSFASCRSVDHCGFDLSPAAACALGATPTRTRARRGSPRVSVARRRAASGARAESAKAEDMAGRVSVVRHGGRARTSGSARVDEPTFPTRSAQIRISEKRQKVPGGRVRRSADRCAEEVYVCVLRARTNGLHIQLHPDIRSCRTRLSNSAPISPTSSPARP